MTAERHEAMRGLWQAVIDIADNLTEDEWSREVPWTPGWTVADLVSHFGGLQSALNGAPQPDPPADWTPPTEGKPIDIAVAAQLQARREWTPQQRLDELHRSADAHVASLAATADWLDVAQGPTGPKTKDGLFHVRCFDVWVHLQDLLDALGRPLELDDASEGAAAAHSFILGLVPWMFVKRAGADEGSTMRVTLGKPLDHDNVLRVTNGRATWDPTADAGDCSLTGLPGALTLLVAGRGTAQQWRNDGVLSWTGPRGEDFVERARTF